MSPLQQAVAAHQKGDLNTARSLYQQVLQNEPANPSALHYYWLLVERDAYRPASADSSEPLQQLERSLQLAPKSPEFRHNIAGIYLGRGLQQQARQSLEQALALRPDYPEALQSLTENFDCSDQPELLSQILRLQQQPGRDRLGQAQLHFAAAQLLDRRGEYADAFGQFRLGNACRSGHYQHARVEQEIERSIRFFTPERARLNAEFGLFSHTPMFIVGMPRSGSTLVEQILSSHSMVHGAGELSDIAMINHTLQQRSASRLPTPTYLQQVAPLDLLSLGQSYLGTLARLSDNSPRVINKNLHNFQHIGLILLMFPNASILHSLRDPVETCLSCYFKNFTHGIHYAFDLHTVAQHYRLHLRLMDHWKAVYPGRIHTHRHESLLADQQGVTRQLLDYCQLPWEDACLDYRNNGRQVRTASRSQIRQPLFSQPSEKWRHYEPWIQPLLEALDDLR